MIIFFKKYYPIIFIFCLVGIFFYKTIFYNLIPFPGDMLVGAYYPWLDHKWSGLETSVPIKNPLISDVFSQLFIWKKLIIDSLKNFQFPLWNNFSYSGYPLLANFQSGVFNPFNLFLLFFGVNNGWTLLIIAQFLFSFIFMYLFLIKQYPTKKLASLAGSFTYSFSGFMVIWSEFATAGFAMVWLPLIFLNIEKFFETKKIKYILFLPLLNFILMTSGHLQVLIYSFIITGCYFLFKYFSKNNHQKKSGLIWYFIVLILSILLMAVQLFPSLELGKNSVRFDENYISEYNYGLLSTDRVVTLFAPDYFGNPTTFNFWGTFNYHETILYSGILSVFALLFCLYNFKKLKNEKFFLFATILSLLFVFDTYFGRLIYKLKIPLLSTSAAGRLVYIYVFSLSVLVAFFIKNINLHNFKKCIKYYWGYFGYLFIVTVLTYFSYKNSISLYPLQNNFYIAFRNLFIPILLSGLILFVLMFVKNIKIKNTLLILILIIDLFRFGWKYLPFTSKEYIYPETQITNYLKTDNTIFRIEKEKGPLMTPNVWLMYGIQSTSGYDPMALKAYSTFYQKILNKDKNGGSSRYSELDNYDSISLGEANVKYLLALNYDDIDNISPTGTKLNYKIDKNNWQEVYRYKSVSILKNKDYKERFEVLYDPKSTISNINYSSNKITLDINSSKTNNVLVLRDTWYPGWQATINGKVVNIDKYLNIYRQVNLTKGDNHVEFIYKPKSFYVGLYLSFFSAFVCLVLYIKNKNKFILN